MSARIDNLARAVTEPPVALAGGETVAIPQGTDEGKVGSPSSPSLRSGAFFPPPPMGKVISNFPNVSQK